MKGTLGKVNMPNSLIAPNSNIRGNGQRGCKKMKGKGILVDLKASAKQAEDRTKPAPGWGSNAQANYEPVPNGTPRF